MGLIPVIYDGYERQALGKFRILRFKLTTFLSDRSPQVKTAGLRYQFVVNLSGPACT